MSEMIDIINWENIVAALQLHCENQRDAMRNPAKVEATGDFIATFFGVDRVALATKTMDIVMKESPPLHNSWGYRLHLWIKAQK